MEAQTPFVRANGWIELHTEAPVNMGLSFVIPPRDPKDDDPFWFHDAF